MDGYGIYGCLIQASFENLYSFKLHFENSLYSIWALFDEAQVSLTFISIRRKQNDWTDQQSMKPTMMVIIVCRMLIPVSPIKHWIYTNPTCTVWTLSLSGPKGSIITHAHYVGRRGWDFLVRLFVCLPRHNSTRRMAIAKWTCVSWVAYASGTIAVNVTWMDRKRIQCLSNASQHVPIYFQPFLRYSGISVASD